MADSSEIQEFPDISNKLAAPTKKSLFERQKAEAEAKRQREEAETAAVYEDFVKSFDDEQGPSRSSTSRDRLGGNDISGPPSRILSGAPPRRHFAGPTSSTTAKGGLTGTRSSLPSSGPGSLGPPPGPLSRKRNHDGYHPAPRDKGQGLFAFEDAPSAPPDTKTTLEKLGGDDAHNDEDEDEVKGERTAPKPALHLSSLAPGTSPAVIKSLLPPSLTVDTVRILPPVGPGSSERKSMSAIVVLAKDTPASEVDAAVSALQNRYLGCGYYLTIARHLSSAITTGVPASSGSDSMLTSMPFGARPVPMGPGGGFSRAPPPPSIHRGGYAPPSSYGPSYGRGGPPSVQVSVSPPSDLKQLRLIHKTLEALLTHGPEFEALLMSRAEVQREERWAWIWDPRSPGAVWYRWRLWEILSRSHARSSGRGLRTDKQSFLFDGGAPWVAPRRSLRFEYTTRLDEFVSDSEYDSSEEESGDEEPRRQHHHGGHGPPELAMMGDGDEKAYLSPLQKAKLTHLLARLPTSNAKLRKGDVARVTAFAIRHAGEGADEVVDMIVSNILKPFAFTGANPDRKRDAEQSAARANDDEGDDKDMSKDQEDTSSSKLVALYVVSDILSSSSTSGVRHAWRYRQLFEAAFKSRKVFEHLGQLEKTLHWGRLRTEKWRRSVNNVLTLWESWCVFPQASHEHFVSAFAAPPAPPSGTPAATSSKPQVEQLPAAKSRWRTVDETASLSEGGRQFGQLTDPTAAADSTAAHPDVDGEVMPDDDDDDIDGEPMSDVDGEPMDEDLDGDLMETGEDDGLNAQPGTVQNQVAETPNAGGDRLAQQAAQSDQDQTTRRRSRPRAEDMFADSDEDL